MPIYELLCHECYNISEWLMSPEDVDEKVMCPDCQTTLTRRKNRTYTNPPSVNGAKGTSIYR